LGTYCNEKRSNHLEKFNVSPNIYSWKNLKKQVKTITWKFVKEAREQK